jgi:hypothetical protein
VRRLRANHPRERWLWEHPWNAFASFDETRAELRRGIHATMAIGTFLLPFNWIAFAGGQRLWLFVAVTSVFDAAILAAIGRLVHLALRLRRYGTTELRLPRFPCFGGDEVELKLVRSPALAGIAALRGTLRCVQERYESSRSGRGRRVVLYVLHEETVSGAPTKAGEAIAFRFAVPPGAPESALDERPPRYWELRVEGETPGVDYGATFLVPIYARPD